MPISFIGDIPASTDRVVTGLYSLDWALGDSAGGIGFPLRSLVEVYGPKSIGKTSTVLSIMGILATHSHKNVTILDLEIQERLTIEQILAKNGFDGDVFYLTNDGKERPEDTLERFTDRMMDKNPDIAMVDSIGAYYPDAVYEGKIGDRNVGQKPMEMGQFSARLMRGLRLATPPNSVFMTNHVHPTFGGLVVGQETSGGVTKKFLSHIRMDLKRYFLGQSVVDFGTSWLIKGKIDSNRFGYSKREFQVFMIGGEGIHLGLSAMWDCIVNNWAELSSKKPTESTSVSMDGQGFGKLGTILRDRNTEPERFISFINKIKEMSNSDTESIPDEEEEKVEEVKPKKKSKK